MDGSPIRINGLKINDFMRVTAVQMQFDGAGNLVIISGKNGQGKTSVLNAIAMALGGGKVGKETILPIRTGQTKADVEIDFGDFTVSKVWETDHSPKLVVMSKDGATYHSPQAFLDARIGALSFDPFAFTRKAPKDQLADLLDVVPLPFDPLDLQAERDMIFGQRTDVNRRVRDLEGKLAGFTIADEDSIPDEPVSTAKVLEDLGAAQEVARRNDNVQAERQLARNRVNAAAEAFARAQHELSVASAAFDAAKDDADSWNARTLEEVPDVASFQDLLIEAEHINERIRLRTEKRQLADDTARAQQESVALTDQLEAIDKRKNDAMLEASESMPVPGLGFDQTGVTYGGIPFAQCSAAEQLRVSTAMAMALNPTIRVIRITDGSLLDADNMAVLEEMAGDQGFQVLIERVTNESGIGFEMVDGALAE